MRNWKGSANWRPWMFSTKIYIVFCGIFFYLFLFLLNKIFMYGKIVLVLKKFTIPDWNLSLTSVVCLADIRSFNTDSFVIFLLPISWILPWDTPSLLSSSNSGEFLLGQCCQNVKQATYLHLIPRINIRAGLPLLVWVYPRAEGYISMFLSIKIMSDRCISS